jgi:CRISP-associated protein Cas1
MSHHIVHLLSPHLRVRMRLDQLQIEDREKGTQRSVPLRDIALLICAASDTSFSAGSLRRAAELGVLVLICDEKFCPAALSVPYYRATTAEVPQRQAAWTPEWKATCWRTIITAKVRAQATALTPTNPRMAETLRHIAEKCQAEPIDLSPSFRDPRRLAKVTASQRDALRAWTPQACESRAARLYWHALLPRLDGTGHTRIREPGTRDGINGMLDYGYAVLRAAVLRSLAGHGFIAALGLHHTTKPGAQPLADDLMEPLRPFCDAALVHFLATPESLSSPDHAARMKLWCPLAAQVLLQPLPYKEGQVRLLNAIDLYVQSLAAAQAKPHLLPPLLRIPPFCLPS